MFETIIATIGITPFFVLTLLIATLTTPVGMFVRRSRPLLGSLLHGFGLVLQVSYGISVALAMYSETIMGFFTISA